MLHAIAPNPPSAGGRPHVSRIRLDFQTWFGLVNTKKCMAAPIELLLRLAGRHEGNERAANSATQEVPR
jgi:hypothetical protein